MRGWRLRRVWRGEKEQGLQVRRKLRYGQGAWKERDMGQGKKLQGLWLELGL